MENKNLKIVEVAIDQLQPAAYNPRTHSKEQMDQLKKSITKFGLLDPIILNSAPERKNIIIGGHFRAMAAKELEMKTVPVIYVRIEDIEKEKELNIRLNKNTGDFDLALLSEYTENFLEEVGFNSEEIDNIFPVDETPDQFDLQKELDKLKITEIRAKTGDIYDLDGSRLMVGDSTIESDTIKLMNGNKADMCLTDPPYILDYLKGKTKNKDGITEGFGTKKNRIYLGTDSLPDNFTELWMGNINKAAKEDFSIIVYENWKNLRTIWGEMEKYWKVKNMIVWHLKDRNQGFSAKYRLFNKHDIAMVGGSESVELNMENEGDEMLDNEYETALYAISGRPQWESYGKGKQFCPTDFIEYTADDEKSSGQGIVFGTKPLEILIPYIKILTKRGDLIVEPFGGSGSTLIAATRMGRRCFIMEKCPTYAEVIIKRWERETGKTVTRINS